MEDNPYQVLRVAEDAPYEVVQAAFRAMSKLHHPDRGSNPDARMQEKINSAWASLQSDIARARVDAELARERDTQTGPGQGWHEDLGKEGWGSVITDPAPSPAGPPQRPTKLPNALKDKPWWSSVFGNRAADRIRLALPPGAAFPQIVRAVDSIWKISIKSTNPSIGVIEGTVAGGGVTWGERIRIQIVPDGGGGTFVEVMSYSRPKTALVDFGRNDRHVTQILNAIDRRMSLGDSSDPAM